MKQTSLFLKDYIKLNYTALPQSHEQTNQSEF